MKLLTTFFEVDSVARLVEFKFCIETLCSLSFIEEYHIFFEGDVAAVLNKEDYAFLKNTKIRLVQVTGRPTYKLLIDYANCMMLNTICGIVNADIYFDESAKRITEAPMEKRFYAITRISNGRHQNPGSQDFWVFKTPLHISPDIYIGVNGCDSFFAQQVFDAGYKVLNPCLTIHIHHKHTIMYRHRPFSLASGDYWAAPGYRSVEIPYSAL